MLARMLPVLFLVCLVGAQSPEANISGIVSDTQSAVVPNATVSALNLATGQTTTAKTNETGLYVLRALPIGQYELSVEAAGFRKHVRKGITLTTGQSLAIEVTLEVGAVSEVVNVTAASATVETRTSDVSQLVESKTIEDMPIGDRRAMNIINITGAAVFVGYDSGSKPNFSLAGGRTQSQQFFIDGGTGQNMRLGIGQIDLDPPVEVTSEVKVLANSYAAEYGGSAGGVIIATTKSGTNQLKGTLFEYLRNEKLDAGNFFAPWVNNQKVRAPLRYNVFGGTVGGPVAIPKLYNGKDKTFFFFAYEGSRRGQGETRQFTTPTAEWRTGDFSALTTAAGARTVIYDPSTTRNEGGRNVRDPYPGNRIPSNQLDPVALNVMKYWPAPNRTPDNLSQANNFRSNYVSRLTRDNYTAKVDHNLTDQDKLTFRYLYNSDDVMNTSVFPEPAADTLTDTLRHQHYTYLSYNRIFTPTLLNELRFNYGNRINWAISKGVGGGWPTKLGIKGVSDNAFPQFNVTGLQGLSSGAQERRQFPIQQYQIVNNLSWVKNRHSMKFGFEWRPSLNFETNLPTVSGAFTFSPLSTGLPGSGTTGFGLASMLVGLPLNFGARETQALDRISTYWAWFVQDDWTVSKNLTLNIGLRWETDSPIYDKGNRMNGFDQTQANPVSGTPGVVKFMGLNGFRTTPYSTDRNNFGPRFGFAWKVLGSERTVLRGGYGIYFAHPFDAGAPTAASLGFENSLTLNSVDNGITHPFLLRNGLTGFSLQPPALNDRFGSVAVGQNPNTAVTAFETTRRTGYAQMFNLTLQRELMGGVLTEVAYIGNLSRKLPSANLPVNQIPWDVLSAATANQRFRPYPQFTGVTLLLPSLGVSNYNALSARVEKRFAKGFNVLATYTWSSFLNNTSEGGNTVGNDAATYSDLYNRRLDYGPSGNDVKHRMTLSSVYELPFGKGKPRLNSSAWRHLAGDWSLGGVMLLQSGAPLTLLNQVDTRNNFAAGGLRVDRIADGNLPADQRRPEKWFDTAAFGAPAPFRNGTAGIGIVRADGRINFDISVLKNIPVGEGRKFQIRGEFFNVTNKTNFGNPGTTLGGPGFGVVGSAAPARQIQVGARFVW